HRGAARHARHRRRHARRAAVDQAEPLRLVPLGALVAAAARLGRGGADQRAAAAEVNRRRQLLCCILLAPLAARAQQPRMVRIGFLAAPYRLEYFHEGMRRLGYLEGKNLAVDSRWDTDYERLGQIAGEMVRARVDLLVTGGTPA